MRFLMAFSDSSCTIALNSSSSNFSSTVHPPLSYVFIGFNLDDLPITKAYTSSGNLNRYRQPYPLRNMLLLSHPKVISHWLTYTPRGDMWFLSAYTFPFCLDVVHSWDSVLPLFGQTPIGAC